MEGGAVKAFWKKSPLLVMHVNITIRLFAICENLACHERVCVSEHSGEGERERESDQCYLESRWRGGVSLSSVEIEAVANIQVTIIIKIKKQTMKKDGRIGYWRHDLVCERQQEIKTKERGYKSEPVRQHWR